jgi:hypothetical protein
MLLWTEGSFVRETKILGVRIRNLRVLLSLPVLACAILPVSAQQDPKIELSNGLLSATIYRPDPRDGFYRGTRFDWAGVIARLEYKGHSYFGPFFDRFDAGEPDVIVGPTIVAGANSAASGPVEEFLSSDGTSLGYSDAKVGEPFYKIGVGTLQKPEEKNYSSFQHYTILDVGQRTTRTGKDWIEFAQVVKGDSGHSYIYRKTIRFKKSRPIMILEHSLKNTGHEPIEAEVYDHNFLRIDRQTSGPEIVVTFPFQPLATEKMDGMAEIRGDQIIFLKELKGSDTLYTLLEGFGKRAADYRMQVENRKTGAGVIITGNRPLAKLAFWAIRTVVAPEPFIHIRVEPGQEYRWRYQYEFYAASERSSTAH